MTHTNDGLIENLMKVPAPLKRIIYLIPYYILYNYVPLSCRLLYYNV